jgi:hypothetical protein
MVLSEYKRLADWYKKIYRPLISTYSYVLGGAQPLCECRDIENGIDLLLDPGGTGRN